MSYPKIMITPTGLKANKIVEKDERYISPFFGARELYILKIFKLNCVKSRKAFF